jgi:hypothetical protein
MSSPFNNVCSLSAAEGQLLTDLGLVPAIGWINNQSSHLSGAIEATTQGQVGVTEHLREGLGV